ncbi:MAG: hypothetical protein MJZ58_01100, partial [Paludibacteraceae bacterium]|nr:hypothetical protein [Paludibacteraceae bacterium]
LRLLYIQSIGLHNKGGELAAHHVSTSAKNLSLGGKESNGKASLALCSFMRRFLERREINKHHRNLLVFIFLRILMIVFCIKQFSIYFVYYKKHFFIKENDFFIIFAF